MKVDLNDYGPGHAWCGRCKGSLHHETLKGYVHDKNNSQYCPDGGGEVALPRTDCVLGMCVFQAEQGSKYCKHHRVACEAHDVKIQQKTDWCQCAEFMPIPDPKVCAKCHKPIYYMAWPASQTARSQRPVAYACPSKCGCIWRDNEDGTMSLFGPNSKSCLVCEFLPLTRLVPLYDGEAIDAATCDGLERAYLASMEYVLTNPTAQWAANEFAERARRVKQVSLISE